MIGQSEEKIAFLFPGQGSQYINMGKYLYEQFPVFADTVDTIDRYCREEFKLSVRDAIYPKQVSDEAVEKINTILFTQLTIFTIEIAMLELIQSLGVSSQYTIGHSFGELAALVAGGVWDVETGFKAVAARIHALETIGRPLPGKMLSINGNINQAQSIIQLVKGRLQVANQNLPNQVVFGGSKDDIEKAFKVAEIVGLDATILPIEGAFHSDFLEPAVDPFYQSLRTLPCKKPNRAVLSTIDGTFYKPEEINAEFLAKKISKQLTTPIFFPREIDILKNNGVQSYIEVGPKWTLTTFVKNIVTPDTPVTIPLIHPKIGDKEQFARALSSFLVHGIGDPMSMINPHQSWADSFDRSFFSFLRTRNQNLYDQLVTYHQEYKLQTPTNEGIQPEYSERARVKEAPADKHIPAAKINEPKPMLAPTTYAAHSTTNHGISSAGSTVTLSQLEGNVRSKIAAKTGYPEEMLESHLDLEADLGIDTVKQAEIWMELGKEYQIQSSGQVQLRDYNTIQKLAQYIGSHHGGTNSIPTTTSVEPRSVQPSGVTTAPVSVPLQTTLNRSNLEAQVRSRIASKTGYPEEMLENDLDLEADLGIDTVKQAEIWVELGKEFNLQSGGQVQLRDFNTIRKLADYLATNVSGSAPKVVESTSTSSQRPYSSQPVTTADTSKGHEPVTIPLSVPSEEIESHVRSRIAAKTGYPEEMLENDLDLEADLGIDTVKQAEIWVELGKDYNLTSGGSVQLRDYNTIRKLTDFIKDQTGAESLNIDDTSATISIIDLKSVPTDDLETDNHVEQQIRGKIAAKTGYPEDMLEGDLDLEGDLGIDTVKQAEIWVELGKEFNLPPQGEFGIKDLNTINKISSFVSRQTTKKKALSQ